MSKLLIPNTCQVPNVLLDEVMPTLAGSALKVLLAIVRKTYGFQKRSDRISFTTLQQLTGLSRDAVNRGIKALGPLLKITPGTKNVPTLEGVNEYALNLDVETGELVRKSDQSENLTSQKSRNELVLKSDSSKPILSKPNKTGAKAPLFSSHSRKRKLTRPDPATLEAFARFYEAYPRHVGKADAEKAWLKLNPDPELTAKILAGVQRYAADARDCNPKYIKHPGPWLNGRRWEDEPPGGNSNSHGPPKAVKDLGGGWLEVDGVKTQKARYEREHGKPTST